jgi:hypothetical protein
VHQSMIPFQTEHYSRPRHLAASFPSPLTLKNRKNAIAKSPDSLADPVYYMSLLFTAPCATLLQSPHRGIP